jgi:hypothetical protein
MQMNKEIMDTIEYALRAINGEPRYEKDFVCKFPTHTGARICIHRLILLMACYTHDGDRLIPTHPGDRSTECKHGDHCPSVIALCVLQWSNGRHGTTFQLEERRNLSGCNFRHTKEEIDYIRENVFNFLYCYYTYNYAVENMFGRLTEYYNFVRRKPYQQKTIRAYSYKERKNIFRAIYHSDDRIFEFPIEEDEEEQGEIIDDNDEVAVA